MCRAVVLLFLLSSGTFPIVFASPVLSSGGTIDIGSRGDEVRVVQKLLADAGFYAGEIDGIYGSGTQRAVKEFQQSNGLTVSGVVDKETVLYLERAGGEPSRYNRSLLMRASAYTANDPGCSGFTYRGNQLRRGLVAVDPTVIPLGTRLYINGYGYAIADDIGSSIKENRIDLSFDSRAEAFSFGVRNVTVYILD
ncbi:MAG TPA: peptidoglycan-binding protein [Methylomusa anaerophila]|uniref:peptidoglycan-binding protein n=1 Tax=Methylomusa anaerophila TaxID=1930071 RepID=UPI001E402099|nr:peptidoglycan-binding protein [Methylomusa anaerophila]HML87338.1 peptidoglycan-binding protein [Methylomusa anaerophila]